MLGGIGNLMGMLKHAKEIQSRMGEVQAELAKKRYTGEAGGGAVIATMDGKGVLVDIKIEPSAVSDVELLEDLIKAAVGGAAAKSQEAMREELGKLTGGLNLPGMDQVLGGG